MFSLQRELQYLQAHAIGGLYILSCDCTLDTAFDYKLGFVVYALSIIVPSIREIDVIAINEFYLCLNVFLGNTNRYI